MIKRYHLLISTIVLLILFIGALHFFIAASNRYTEQQEKVAVLRGRLEFLKQQRSELEYKVGVLKEVKQFVDKAASLGLAQERWSFYNVNLQEAVTHEKMARILNQCVNSDSAYFKPESLHVKSMDPGSIESGSKITPAASENQSGDVFITFKGKFVVRQE